jgi:8-oxo-dGTP pyrophosphatase MutT (NUDIX family)
MAKPYQVAALPVRRSSAGTIEVLLVTSRETRRWVVPKGWPWRKVEDHNAAAGEAWEEAGVRGTASPESIGTFTYGKRRKGKVSSLTVLVYLLEVQEESATWPEADQRSRSWFHPTAAARLVDEPELQDLLRGLDKEPL